MVPGSRLVIDYADLLTHEALGLATMLAPGTRTTVDVEGLLNAVRSPDERPPLLKKLDRPREVAESRPVALHLSGRCLEHVTHRAT